MLRIIIDLYFENKKHTNALSGEDSEDSKCPSRQYVKVKQSYYSSNQASRFQDNRHMKVVSLSALRTGHLYPQEMFLVLISFRG